MKSSKALNGSSANRILASALERAPAPTMHQRKE
jgi:hypothetical protein